LPRLGKPATATSPSYQANACITRAERHIPYESEIRVTDRGKRLCASRAPLDQMPHQAWSNSIRLRDTRPRLAASARCCTHLSTAADEAMPARRPMRPWPA